jgi:hypothetical protein
MNQELRKLILNRLDSIPNIKNIKLPNNPGLMDVICEYSMDLSRLFELKKAFYGVRSSKIDDSEKDIIKSYFHYKNHKNYFQLRRFFTVNYTDYISDEDFENFTPVVNHFSALKEELDANLVENYKINTDEVLYIINQVNSSSSDKIIQRDTECINVIYCVNDKLINPLMELIHQEGEDCVVALYSLLSTIPQWNSQKRITVTHTKDFHDMKSPYSKNKNMQNISYSGEFAYVIYELSKRRYRLNGIYSRYYSKYWEILLNNGYRFANERIEPYRLRDYIYKEKDKYVLKREKDLFNLQEVI